MPEKRNFEMTEEEEAQHAKVGAWVGLIIFPFILLCICGVFAATPGGRLAFYELVMQFSRDGVPYMEDAGISYTRGFTGTARASCKLNQQSPQQEPLTAEYETLVSYYKDYWRNFRKGGGDIENYEMPEDVPSDLFGGRLRYCNR